MDDPIPVFKSRRWAIRIWALGFEGLKLVLTAGLWLGSAHIADSGGLRQPTFDEKIDNTKSALVIVPFCVAIFACTFARTESDRRKSSIE